MVPNHVEKQIKRDIQTLRKIAKKSKVITDDLAVKQTLRENLRFMEQEAADGRKQIRIFRLKFHDDTRLSPLCEDAVLHFHQSISQSLTEQLRKQTKRLSIGQLSTLPYLLKAHLIHLAVMGVKNRNTGMLESAISGLHQLKDLDMEQIFSEFSHTEKVFMQDPAAIYPDMETSTKAYYREMCAANAVKYHCTEFDFADSILKRARKQSSPYNHIGFPLLEKSWEAKRRKVLGKRLIFLQIILPFIVGILLAVPLKAWWLTLPAYPLLYAIISKFLQQIFQKNVAPHFMPRMDLKQTIPPAMHTLVTVSSLIPKPEQAKKMGKHLEQLLLANRNGSIDICLLADFSESKTKQEPDDELAVTAISEEFQRLNAKYDNRFILLIRPRVYSKTQDAYSGWERKRGAVLQLTQAIMTHNTDAFHTVIDPCNRLYKAKYILALDQDSTLPFQAAYELITAAAHPLNQPIVSNSKQTVISGYGILSPQITNQADSVNHTLYSKILSPRGGLSAYHAFCSNHRQDLWGQIAFCGKGLIHVSAYYTCLKEAIPQEKLLSHDIVEGAFLRCGLVSDVEIADGNPDNAIAWNKRHHRWVRGDFQNVLWLLPNVKAQQIYANPLCKIARFMIMENILQTLEPIVSLLLLIIGALYHKFAAPLVLIVAISYFASGIVNLLISILKNGFSVCNQQYYSRLLPSSVIALVQGFYKFSNVATIGAITLDGVIKGLYRQFISHKRCMEWTTAHQVDFDNQSGLPAYLYHNLSSLVVGISFLLSPSALIKAVGIMFITAPFFQWQTAKPLPVKPHYIAKEDREYLLEEGRKIWQYYQDFATREHHFLPPDNVQEHPIYAVAPRTSPTNIGLMLLSAVCSEDLGYIDEQQMVNFIDCAYTTVEKLERFHGHLLNWYNTKTCEPLIPRYCSTVDSGNFACLLTTVVNRLRTISTEQAKKLIIRMEQDLANMDFGIFYNAHRQLFHIGFDLEANTLSNAYYDMLMSEARMTSYYAVAKGQIPKKHWHTLGRVLTKNGRHVGLMSWTGTMFEYLMPTLILPTKLNTLHYEAIHFSIATQKNAARLGQPWGCSESGYYEFDEQFNYQYKPNGSPQLAIKYFDNKEYIVAPYATFLALPFTPKNAMDNLKRLQAMHVTGKYGFYEAIDFTKKRCKNEHPEIVKSYMAHHIGMSLCAIENHLNNNRLSELFMQNEMAGAKTLLSETIPEGTAVYRPYIGRNIPEKPRFYVPSSSPQQPSPFRPVYTLFSNEQRSCLLGCNGEIISKWKDLILYGTSTDMLETSLGFIIQLEVNGISHFLTFAPHYQNQNNYTFETRKNQVIYTYKTTDFTATMHFSVTKNRLTEHRKITVKSRSGHPLTCRLTVFFQPLLHTGEQIRSHQAYYKLFIKTKYDQNSGRISFIKNTNNEKEAVILLAGFANEKPNEIQCNTQNAIRYHNNTFQILQRQNNDFKSIPNPCCCMSLLFTLQPKQTIQKQFVMAVGETNAYAEHAFDTYATAPRQDVAFPSQTPEGKIAATLLTYLLQPIHTVSRRYRTGIYERNNLWQAGISGDLPILVASIRQSFDLEQLKPYLDSWLLLKKHGIRSDFVIMYKEYGDYLRTVSQNLLTLITKCGLEANIGKKAGIHFINTATCEKKTRTAILSSAAYVITRSLPPFEKNGTCIPIHLLKTKAVSTPYPIDAPVSGGYFSHNRFVVTKQPKVPWSHLLAGPKFGTQLTDKSLGFTYAYNARENRLTPWSNDPVIHHVGERLILKAEHLYYDLIDGSTAVFSPEQAEYFGEVVGVTYCVTVTVRQMQKRVTVHFDMPLPNGSQIAYYTQPTLDFDRKHANQIYNQWIDNIPVLHQPYNTAYHGWMCLQTKGASEYCFDMHDFWTGQWNKQSFLPADRPCLACIAKAEQIIDFTLSYGDDPQQAVQNGDFSLTPIQLPYNAWHLKSNQPLLDVMVNHFLPHQIFTARLFARTGFYQCSGAYGFRDQLQDAGNVLMIAPQITKKQILRCCSRQFQQGDVLHWWHELPDGPVGVRTRCSDDMLWLPYTVARYVVCTGDTEILNISIPYLNAPELTPDRQEQYITKFTNELEESVYQHCKRALSIPSLSNRGLAKIGSCDWNDGFSHVGKKGNGESVWLTQFYAMVCESFSTIAEQQLDFDFANQLKEQSAKSKQAVERHAWDNDRYTRAYFDDGQVIGAAHCEENRLDVLPQAFSVLANLPNQKRNHTALMTAYETLVSHEGRLIQLFSPPFQKVYAGYISNYPPGIRENGGQYTHGVAWLVAALFQIGQGEKAYQLLEYLNPATHCQKEEQADIYEGEPYAVAGDIYTHPDAYGKCGWTHYTGAAGWLYRIIWEDLFGIHLNGDILKVNPCLPKILKNAACTITWKNKTLRLIFQTTKPLSAPLVLPLNEIKTDTVIVKDSM